MKEQEERRDIGRRKSRGEREEKRIDGEGEREEIRGRK
jgi:hypothetical protein